MLAGFRLDSSSCLVSDRTFLVKARHRANRACLCSSRCSSAQAVRVLKAAALLAGRDGCELEDLKARAGAE